MEVSSDSTMLRKVSKGHLTLKLPSSFVIVRSKLVFLNVFSQNECLVQQETDAVMMVFVM